MRRTMAVVLTLAVSLASGAEAAQVAVGRDVQTDVMVTIYNGNLGLVKDVRQTRLPTGLHETEFTDVAESKNRLEQAAPATKSAETNAEPTAPARDAPPALEKRRANVDSITTDPAKAGRSRQDAAPLSRTGPMTGILGAPPDVTAQLRAADASAAERSLIELAGRLGGRQTGRRIDGGRVVVELAVPREAYAQFVREATALGPLSLEQQTTDRPLLSVAVTVSN